MAEIDAKGRLRRSNVSDGEANEILTALNSGKSVKEVARAFGRDESTVQKLMVKYKPTTTIARAALQAKALELVEKVMDKADIDQLIDILSRPNLNVLEPIPKGPSTQGGFNLAVGVSVQAGSLGAVNEKEFAPTDPQKVLEGETIEGKNIRMGPLQVGQFSGDK